MYKYDSGSRSEKVIQSIQFVWGRSRDLDRDRKQ
jgi:hypothetical protein